MVYKIDPYCICCGECAPRCPQQAILPPDDTSPIYHIDASKCTGCGICFDNCTLGVITAEINADR